WLKCEDALQKSVLALPRSVDAQILALLLGAAQTELAERVVQVPGHKLKSAALRIQMEVVVLAWTKDAVQRGKPDRDSHETGKFVQVEVVGHASGEFRRIGMGNQ